MLVAGVIEVGLIEVLAEAAVALMGGDTAATAMLLLWLSRILSDVVVLYTVTMIPVVQQLSEGLDSDVLWWSLALGAELGGNATIAGVSANVILVNFAAREGHPMGFWQFLKYGLLVTVGRLQVSTIYIWLRYLL